MVNKGDTVDEPSIACQSTVLSTLMFQFATARKTRIYYFFILFIIKSTAPSAFRFI